MNDAEVDELVARLVREFERIKLQSIEARGECLAMSARDCVDSRTMALAHARWQALEGRCQDILGHIEQLAERNAA